MSVDRGEVLDVDDGDSPPVKMSLEMMFGPFGMWIPTAYSLTREYDDIYDGLMKTVRDYKAAVRAGKMSQQEMDNSFRVEYVAAAERVAGLNELATTHNIPFCPQSSQAGRIFEMLYLPPGEETSP